MQILVIPTHRQYSALPADSSYQSTADIVADARTIIESAHDAARAWYAREASEQGWSVRTLARNVFRMFDDKIRRADDNPTIGIVLTSETSEEGGDR